MHRPAARALTELLLVVASVALAGCSEVLEPVRGLGDALQGLLESLPF